LTPEIHVKEVAYRVYTVMAATLACASCILGIQSIFSQDWIANIALYSQNRKVTHYSLWKYARMTDSSKVFTFATILLVCLTLLGILSLWILTRASSHAIARWCYRALAIDVSIMLIVRMSLLWISQTEFHLDQQGNFEAWRLGNGHRGLSWACVLASASVLTYKSARRQPAKPLRNVYEG
jgi:hypothetical protein